MEITVLTVGPVYTNCYIVKKEGSQSCLVIDPVTRLIRLRLYEKAESHLGGHFANAWTF